MNSLQELYMDTTTLKTHKRKKTQPVDPGDLVSEKNLKKIYKIIGKVISKCHQQSPEIFIIKIGKK